MLLLQFIRKKELDVYFNVRTVALLKFCLILFGVSHWIGCFFYWIPRVQGFPKGDMNDSWLHQFEQHSGVPFQTEQTSLYRSYLVIFYRGLNAITNLAYEPMVPRRLEEMIVCTITIFLQIYVEAYILGESTSCRLTVPKWSLKTGCKLILLQISFSFKPVSGTS